MICFGNVGKHAYACLIVILRTKVAAPLAANTLFYRFLVAAGPVNDVANGTILVSLRNIPQLISYFVSFHHVHPIGTVPAL